MTKTVYPPLFRCHPVGIPNVQIKTFSVQECGTWLQNLKPNIDSVELTDDAKRKIQQQLVLSVESLVVKPFSSNRIVIEDCSQAVINICTACSPWLKKKGIVPKVSLANKTFVGECRGEVETFSCWNCTKRAWCSCHSIQTEPR